MLEGHIETRRRMVPAHENAHGDIHFRIEARWQRAPMPNWWSRLGAGVVTGHYQRGGHRQAHRRMSRLAHYGSTKPPRCDAAGLTHQGVDVTFTYHMKRRLLT
jgi:hypothetical protein